MGGGKEGGLDEETLLVAREFGEDEGAENPFLFPSYTDNILRGRDSSP